MSTLLTNDLRSEAKAYQRDKNHNTKWARGMTAAPGAQCSHLPDMLRLDGGVCEECASRPRHRDQDRDFGRNSGRHRQNLQKKTSGQAATLARKVFKNEVVDAMDGPVAHTSDTSSEEEDFRDQIRDIDAACNPSEVERMYTYEARPQSHILSNAVTQAVKRFENKETEKLVHKEYDVVDYSKEGYEAEIEEEDDFEVIDHSYLK